MRLSGYDWSLPARLIKLIHFLHSWSHDDNSAPIFYRLLLEAKIGAVHLRADLFVDYLSVDAN